MAKFKMDAENVASIIHKGDFSKLRGKSFEMCDNLGMGKKYTLTQLGNKVDRLENTVNQLVVTVNDLVKYVTEGFKQINTRLDYIVQANDLKDLPKANKL